MHQHPTLPDAVDVLAEDFDVVDRFRSDARGERDDGNRHKKGTSLIIWFLFAVARGREG